MKHSRRHLLTLTLGRPPRAASAPIGFEDPALHLVNRLTWGARPDEVDHARSVGLAAYIEEQLNPEAIDDSAMDAWLATRPILDMSRRELHALTNRYYRIRVSLVEAMIARAVNSRRQLLERMVEFWSDHFNMYLGDNEPEFVRYQAEVVRLNALGSFRDLLIGTARSHAMLVYLDNYLNVAEHPNENYGRELLELHTLGVDGGYTESDVKAVARAFTGWTISDATDDGFYFNMDEHDSEAKTILGHAFPSGRGIEDGLHVLSLLANHPMTARYVCHKLCVRFVSDDPPAELVEGAAQVWAANDGQIAPILRYLFTHPAFYEAAGQKYRRPLDFLVGVLRATGTEIHAFWRLDEMLDELAQPPYGWHPPDGYPDVAGAWINSGGMLARWNLALELSEGAYSDQEERLVTHLRERVGTPDTVGGLVDAVSRQVFGVTLPPDLRAVYVEYVDESGDADATLSRPTLARVVGTLYGLMLASPEYQWR